MLPLIGCNPIYLAAFKEAISVYICFKLIVFSSVFCLIVSVHKTAHSASLG